MSTLEQGLADEVLAEVARQRLTHREVQQRSGIRPRTWGAYFVQRDRAIPITAVAKVAEALGMTTSELLRRAERRQDELDEHERAAEQALAKLPPDLAEVARRVDREQRDAREDDSPVTDRPSGVVRSATTGS